MCYFSEAEKSEMLEAGYDFDRKLFHEIYKQKAKEAGA
jgi:hypothetical protein